MTSGKERFKDRAPVARKPGTVPADSDDRRARIETAIRERLEAQHVEVIDESHLHAGHAGAASGGGHFRATVVSRRFEGENAVTRQRLVYAALSREMGTDIHALSLVTLTPDQWGDA